MTKINSIYVIDDDAITLFGVKKILAKTIDCDSVSEFHNGQTALNALIHAMENGFEVPDLIFLDINMPIMDGWEFLEEFLRLPIDKKIIINILTSSIDPSDLRRWHYYKDRTDHLVIFKNKPIFSIDLCDILRTHMAS